MSVVTETRRHGDKETRRVDRQQVSRSPGLLVSLSGFAAQSLVRHALVPLLGDQPTLVSLSIHGTYQCANQRARAARRQPPEPFGPCAGWIGMPTEVEVSGPTRPVLLAVQLVDPRWVLSPSTVSAAWWAA